MTLTMRDRLSHYRPGRAHAAQTTGAHITAASLARMDLSIVIVDATHWAVFGGGETDHNWLGEIEENDGLFIVTHGQSDWGHYRFAHFAQAVSYFTEYGLALGLISPGGS